jgi:hypothetical protein
MACCPVADAVSGIAAATLDEIGSHLEHVNEGKGADGSCCSLGSQLEQIKKSQSSEVSQCHSEACQLAGAGASGALGLTDCWQHDNCVQVMYKNTFLHVQLSHEGGSRQRSKSCDVCPETTRCPTHAEMMEPLPRHYHHASCARSREVERREPRSTARHHLANQPLRAAVSGSTTIQAIASHLAHVQDGVECDETCKFRGPAEAEAKSRARASERSARFEVSAAPAPAESRKNDISVKVRHGSNPGKYVHVQLDAEHRPPKPSAEDDSAERSATPVTPQLWPIYQRPEPAGPSGPSRGLALESFQLPTNASELIDQVHANLITGSALDSTPAPAPRRQTAPGAEKKHRKKRPAGEEKKQLRPGEKSVLLSGVPEWYTTQHLVTLCADCGILATQEVDFIYLPRRPPPGANGRSAVINLRSPEGEVAFTSVFQGCCLPGSTLHSVITKAKVQGWVNNVAYFASASRDSKANRPYVLQSS